MFAALQRIAPSDINFWTELNAHTRHAVRLVDPIDARLPHEERMVAQFASDHPGYAHYQRTGDGSAHRILDFVGREWWRRSALYNELYRPRGIEEQISFFLRRTSITIGVQLNRGQRAFGEHDRLALNLLRPHVVEIYRSLDAADGMRRALAQARSVIDDLDCGVALIDGNGRIAFANERAWRAFAAYFADVPRRADAMPESIERWVRADHDRTPRDVAHPRSPLVVRRGGRQLVVRLVKHDGQSVLLLDEGRDAIEPAMLAGLGLTLRETEVLAWVTKGKTDAEIGTILDSRPKTVGKHLEHIYQKLGVETRMAAAARAFEAASLAPR